MPNVLRALPTAHPPGTIGEFAWLRAETMGSLAPMLAGLSWLATLPYLLAPDQFWPGWGVWLVTLGLLGAVGLLRTRAGELASALLVGALLLPPTAFAAASDWRGIAPYFYVPATLVATALLGSRAGAVTATISSGCTVWIVTGGESAASSAVLVSACALIWASYLVAWLGGRNLLTVLDWAWTSSAEAERRLSESRDYQARLLTALRQVEEANYRLERANHALAWARSEADEARRVKAQFAAHVSHELRTPINLIIGFSDLMLNHPDTYADERIPRAYLGDLTALHRSARHLQGLIDDILDLAQIDVGEMPVIKDVTDIGGLVQEAVVTAGPLLRQKGLSVQVDVEPGLPLLHVDRLRVRQVVLNLLANAARFTDKGGVTVAIVCAAECVEVSVRDTGRGIRPSELGSLFQPFRQLEASLTRGRGGTGLGLAISKRFVELHGGTIWARSAGIPGQGSIFGFSLPMESRPAESPSGLRVDSSRRWETSATAPPPEVVVLDDDPAIRALFQRHLEGYRVLNADTEAAALALATQRQPHAVITDLPDADSMAGWLTRWSACARESATRVLACPMPSGRRVARNLGLVDYLVKPVTREALLESIQTVAPEATSVLVVDDDPNMLSLLARMLRSSSGRFRLLRACGGQEALDIMAEVTPDLVLLDLLMPQVDGLTVLERMRADPRLTRVPVVAVSARGVLEAILPSTARSIVLLSDEIMPVNRLLSSVRAILESLPPAEASVLAAEPACPASRP